MSKRTTENRYAADLQCPDCPNAAVRTETIPHRFLYGAGLGATELNCALPVRICSNCGAEFIDEEGEEIRHEAVCRHLGVLTPQEIRSLREGYGSQAAFAALTGIGEASLSRWETGASIQSKAFDNYIRLLQRAENMSILLLRLGCAPSEGQTPRATQFRCIEINRGRLEAQASFVLRPAA